MKLICTDPASGPLASGFGIMPDSCLIRNGEAFYKPNFCSDIFMRPCISIKITKLGKCIAEKFAHRYYKEFALSANFNAKPSAGYSAAAATGFDRSYCIGNFTEVTDLDIDNIAFSANGENLLIETLPSALLINKLISETSAYFTLKIGDILSIYLSSDAISVRIGDTFAARAGKASLETAVK
jgi:hypothetical protein